MTNAPKSATRLAIPNARNRMDGMKLLAQLARQSAKAVFLDPQYRALLDKQAYGNEGEKRERKRVALPQMDNYTVGCFVAGAAHVLAPSGHLFLWLDKFSIGEGLHLRYLAHGKSLRMVDFLAWDKLRIGMGRRTRARTEFLVIAQKEPIRAKGCWSDHGIEDCWREGSDRSIHPHAKPYVLIQRLIRAVTNAGDLVVDPCAGSYVVLEACKSAKREFMGCDLIS